MRLSIAIAVSFLLVGRIGVVLASCDCQEKFRTYNEDYFNDKSNMLGFMKTFVGEVDFGRFTDDVKPDRVYDDYGYDDYVYNDDTKDGDDGDTNDGGDHDGGDHDGGYHDGGDHEERAEDYVSKNLTDLFNNFNKNETNSKALLYLFERIFQAVHKVMSKYFTAAEANFDALTNPFSDSFTFKEEEKEKEIAERMFKIIKAFRSVDTSQNGQFLTDIKTALATFNKTIKEGGESVVPFTSVESDKQYSMLSANIDHLFEAASRFGIKDGTLDKLLNSDERSLKNYNKEIENISKEVADFIQIVFGLFSKSKEFQQPVIDKLICFHTFLDREFVDGSDKFSSFTEYFRLYELLTSEDIIGDTSSFKAFNYFRKAYNDNKGPVYFNDFTGLEKNLAKFSYNATRQISDFKQYTLNCTINCETINKGISIVYQDVENSKIDDANNRKDEFCQNLENEQEYENLTPIDEHVSDENSTGENSTGENSTGENSTGENSTGENSTTNETEVNDIQMRPGEKFLLACLVIGVIAIIVALGIYIHKTKCSTNHEKGDSESSVPLKSPDAKNSSTPIEKITKTDETLEKTVVVNNITQSSTSKSAAIRTSENNVTTDNIQKKEPAETRVKPAETKDKPAESTIKPAETTKKATETPVIPVVITSKPAETMAKPTEILAKPAEAKEKPAENTTKHTETAAKPAVATVKPTQTLTKPAVATVKPAETTAKPAVATVKPAETLTKPAVATVKPAETTAKPAETAAKPAVATVKPAVATVKPAETLAKPAETAAKPAVATVKPAETTAKPAKATVKPAVVTVKPAEILTKPAENAAKPAETAAKPTVAIVKPAETTAKPAVATIKPAETLTKPAETATKPAETAAKPTVATVKPAETTAKPANATVKPAVATAKPVASPIVDTSVKAVDTSAKTIDASAKSVDNSGKSDNTNSRK